MKDPYKTLGVERTATDAEIKKAYYALAKKYHPDNYADSPLADLVSEKMKEINEAYDAITKEREGGYAYAYESEDEESHSGYTSAAKYAGIRTLINARRYQEAMSSLLAVPNDDRGAEWQYLYGCIMLGMGNYTDAVRHIETACYMDPGNVEYATARDSIKRSAASYGRGYSTADPAGSCDTCDVCSSLLCADCLCECCGGDLIRCC